MGSTKVGYPPKRQFLSLIYTGKDGVDVRTDLSGYRPDPRDYLKGDKKYDAQIFFEGDSCHLPQKIIVDGTTFIMIR